MKTIQELRKAGFTLSNAEGCVDCTRIESSAPFYYFNPRSHDGAESVAADIQAATEEGGRYGFILAGDYHSVPETIELPYSLLTVRERNDIVSAYESAKEAMDTLSRRLADLNALVRPFLCR